MHTVFIKYPNKVSYKKKVVSDIGEIERFFNAEIFERDKLDDYLKYYKPVYLHNRPGFGEIIDWFESEVEAEDSWYQIIEDL